MKIQFVTEKVIGDPIHGYIPLTQLEYDLLQLPIMNRLHYLRQTQTAYMVFPGSVTTRFSHVLGAMHLGGKIMTQLFDTITWNTYHKLFPKIPDPKFILQAVRLACLFHDVGHGPFSHAGEEIMLDVMKKNYGAELKEVYKLFKVSEGEPPIHEYFSYKLVSDNDSDIRKEIIRHKGYSKSIVNAVSQLLIKDDRDSFVKDNLKGVKLIRKIVSSHLDADRMDYLLRDSTMSGVQFGQIDADRIINNMAIVSDLKGQFQLAFHERSIGTIEDMLDARFKMYRWFYNHHTVIVTNELMKIALRLMLSEDHSLGKLFYWANYGDGFSTDDYLLSKLREFVDRKKDKFLEVKGLVDRRYMPVSVFKATPDVGRFIQKIKELDGINEEHAVKRKKITSYFGNDGAKKFKKILDNAGSELKKCRVYQTEFQSKPYSPLKGDEKIFLYRKVMENLCELLSESTYFQSINKAYEDITTLSVFYLIPGKMKRELETHKDKIRNLLSEAIASS